MDNFLYLKHVFEGCVGTKREYNNGQCMDLCLKRLEYMLKFC